MNCQTTQSLHYEKSGDELNSPEEKIKAYRSAQNHLKFDTYYLENFMRIQKKITKTLEDKR